MGDDDPIDPFSEYDLYDVIEGNMEGGESTMYEGFHIIAQGNGIFHVQPDGYGGGIDRIDSEEYDDVLELVGDLNSHLGFFFEYTKEERVEKAGKIMTSNKEKAEKNPDMYMHVSS